MMACTTASYYYVATSSTSTSTSDSIWNNWCTSSTTTASYGDHTIYYPSREDPPVPAFLTPEVQEQLREERAREQARQEAVLQEQERRIAKAAKVKKEADERSRDLLLSLLNHAQRQMFEKEGHFDVLGRSGQVYRLRTGRSINVDLVGQKQRLCAVVPSELPVYDQLAAQKLMIETNEDQFLRIAIRH